MPLPSPEILASAAYLAALPYEEREAAMRGLQTLIAAQAPEESLVRPIPVRTLGEYLTADLPNPPNLVSPSLVVPGEITVTIGRSGKGKTTMNIQRILRWGAGLPMFDALPDILVPADGKPIRSLIIENEGAASKFQEGMRTRLASSEHFPAGAGAAASENVLIWQDGGYSSFKVDKADDLALLYRAVERFEPQIIFIEPWRGVWSGNENDNSEVAEVLDLLQRLAADTGVGIILSHHAGKGEAFDMMDRSRGATALDGVVAAMENFEEAKGGELRELSWSKIRYAERELPPIRMEYDFDTKMYKLLDGDDEDRELLSILAEAQGQPLSVEDVCKALGERSCGSGSGASKRILKRLNKLKRDGRVFTQPGAGNFGRGLGWVLGSAESTNHGGMEF